MINLERLKTRVLYYVFILFVLIAAGNMFRRSLFFDKEGKIKKYGMTEDCTPIPLVLVVIVTAFVIGLVTVG